MNGHGAITPDDGTKQTHSASPRDVRNGLQGLRWLFEVWMSRAVGGVVLLIVGAILAVRLFVINVSVVPQNGMYPTIPGGSFVFSWKRPYARIGEAQRGDIIPFKRIEERKAYLYV